MAPVGPNVAHEKLHATQEEPCLLVIAAAADGQPIELSIHEDVIFQWYVTAARKGVGLVVLFRNGTIELYSTRRDRSKAFTEPLSTLAEWSRLHPESGRLQLTMHRGTDVARRLFAGSAACGTLSGLPMTLKQIQLAVELASRAGSLSPAVGSLFRAAHKVVRRVSSETLVASPVLSETARDMAEIGAARIIEEELLIWKAKQVERHRALSRGKASAGERDVSSRPLSSLHANYGLARSGMWLRRVANDAIVPDVTQVLESCQPNR